MSGDRAAEATPESFESYVQNIVLNGYVSLNMAIGSRLHLFETLAETSSSGPISSHGLAQKTGCKERYLREWLACMVTAKVIDYDIDTGLYFLAAHKAEAVLKLPGFKRLVEYSELIPSLGAVQGHLLPCFAESGPPGIPYSVCGGLFSWLSRRQSSKFTEGIFTNLLTLIPGLTEQLTRGISVVDFGCGSGGAINVIARMFPSSTFCGLDIVEQNLQDARTACHDLSNVHFRNVDICDIPADLSSRFDLAIVFDVLHDLPFPEKLLSAILDSLRPGARLVLNEVDAHSDLKQNMQSMFYAAMYCISLHHCMPTSLNTPGGRGLGACGGVEVYRDMLQGSGLVDVAQIHPADGGLYFTALKPSASSE